MAKPHGAGGCHGDARTAGAGDQGQDLRKTNNNRITKIGGDKAAAALGAVSNPQ